MNTFENLYSRRSIRNFNGKNISDEQLKEILKTAYAAPIGRAKYESVMLTVISNREFLDKWEKTVAIAFNNPDMHPFYNAPLVILVSSQMPDPNMYNVNYSNCAIVVQNMAIGATEMGIGACHIWGAVRGLNDELIKELNIPQDFVPCCAIALGQMDEEYTLREVIDNRINTVYFK